jgi:hypothetical protein
MLGNAFLVEAKIHRTTRNDQRCHRSSEQKREIG